MLENTEGGGNLEWTIQRNWQLRVHKTQHEDKQTKNTTQKHHYAQANTNNVNKTWAPL